MTLPLVAEELPWYHAGLRFQCTGCGQCCTGSPGYVWVSEEEIEQMAAFLNLPLQTFANRYLRRIQGRFSLREHPHTYDCVFLKENKCQLYDVRPTQCRTFPWWPSLLKSQADWEAAARYCEGISHQAPVVEAEQINTQLSLQHTHFSSE